MISGKPVTSSTGRTFSPAASSAAAVPPVEMSSTPSDASPRAKSWMPVLSETDSSARPTRTSPGCTIASIGRGRYLDAAGGGGIEPDGAAGDVPDGGGEEVVLERSKGIAYLLRVRGMGQLDGALEDDRPGVHAVVDEVDGDAEHLHAVGQRLLHRAEARERRQQRRVDVDHPLRKRGEEARREQRHVAGEHDELHALGAQPAGDRRVAGRAAGVLGQREDGGGDAGGAATLQRGGIPLVRAHGAPPGLAAVDALEDGLEVRPGAGGEDAAPHPPSSFGKRPPVERRVPAASSASTRASTSSPRRSRKAP